LCREHGEPRQGATCTTRARARARLCLRAANKPRTRWGRVVGRGAHHARAPRPREPKPRCAGAGGCAPGGQGGELRRPRARAGAGGPCWAGERAAPRGTEARTGERAAPRPVAPRRDGGRAVRGRGQAAHHGRAPWPGEESAPGRARAGASASGR
jgi:hypothetical protein